ncbi:MAG: hypothetical protein ACK5WC_07895 [Aphanizomenon sp.]
MIDKFHVGMWRGCDRFLGCESEIACWGMLEMRSLFGMMGERSLFRGCWGAIAVGVWECDRCLGMWGCD